MYSQIIMVWEPGTYLQLYLRSEALILAPQAALRLTLSTVVPVLIPEHILRSSEGL